MKRVLTGLLGVIMAVLLGISSIGLSSMSVYADTNVVVDFNDQMLYTLVKAKLAEAEYTIVDSDDDEYTLTLLQSEAENIKSISITTSNKGYVTDLTGMEAFKSLQHFSIVNTTYNKGTVPEGTITDLSPLSGLTNLSSLHLYGCRVTSLDDITSLTKLTSLILTGAEDIDISKIGVFSNLTQLQLTACGLDNSDFQHILTLTGLTTLTLGGDNYEGNQISDITGISALTNLTKLSLSNNQISDISELASMTQLRELNIRVNPISDISPIASLTNLTFLTLGRDGYDTNEGLPIDGDISALSGLTNLRTLLLSDCDITDDDLSALDGLTNLQTLDVSHNHIMDYSSLLNRGLTLHLQSQTIQLKATRGEEAPIPEVLKKAMTDSTSPLYEQALRVGSTSWGCKKSDDETSATILSSASDSEYIRIHTSNDSSRYSYSIRLNYTITGGNSGEDSGNEDPKDTTPPEVTVNYSTTDETYDPVTVTLTVNEDVKDIEGFTRVDDRTFTKVYETNQEETVTVYDIAGNSSPAKIDVSNIKVREQDPTTDDPDDSDDDPTVTDPDDGGTTVDDESEEIDDTDATEEAEETDSDDGDDSTSSTPKTGDSAEMILWAIVLLSAVSAVVARRVKGKKN